MFDTNSSASVSEIQVLYIPVNRVRGYKKDTPLLPLDYMLYGSRQNIEERIRRSREKFGNEHRGLTTLSRVESDNYKFFKPFPDDYRKYKPEKKEYADEKEAKKISNRAYLILDNKLFGDIKNPNSHIWAHIDICDNSVIDIRNHKGEQILCLKGNMVLSDDQKGFYCWFRSDQKFGVHNHNGEPIYVETSNGKKEIKKIYFEKLKNKLSELTENNEANLPQWVTATFSLGLRSREDNISIGNNVTKDIKKSEVPVQSIVNACNFGYNVIYYGVPGCGKSQKVQKDFPEGNGPDKYTIQRVVFHADYSNADFIGQITPKLTKDVSNNSVIEYKFTPGPFTSILRDAWQNDEKKYALIIEEINRGNAPSIFGEAFQLLDRFKKSSNGESSPDNQTPTENIPDEGESLYGIYNKEMLDVINNIDNNPNVNNASWIKKDDVRIPKNLWIIGTMNTTDQNVFTLDTAFQRRWEMRLIENSFERFSEDKMPPIARECVLDSGLDWEQFCTIINELIVENNGNVGFTSMEDRRLGIFFVDSYYLRVPDGNSDSKNETKEPVLRRFAEKVIKYLWDDAFKFNRRGLFLEELKFLEEVIRKFVNHDNITEENPDPRSVITRFHRIFNDNFKKKYAAKVNAKLNAKLNKESDCFTKFFQKTKKTQ